MRTRFYNQNPISGYAHETCKLCDTDNMSKSFVISRVTCTDICRIAKSRSSRQAKSGTDRHTTGAVVSTECRRWDEEDRRRTDGTSHQPRQYSLTPCTRRPRPTHGTSLSYWLPVKQLEQPSPSIRQQCSFTVALPTSTISLREKAF